MKMLYLEPVFVLSKADGHTPPQGVRAACARGLKLVPEYGGDGLTAEAKARARSMAGGGSVSMANIKRMKAFFARHTEAKTASPPSPGYVAWLLWGGDAGKSWANKMAKTDDQAEKSFVLSVGLSKAGEGSRGGHIIGHTKSGKPIYSANHATYTATTPRGAYSPVHDNSVHQNNWPKMKRLLQTRTGYSQADHEEAQGAHKTQELIHRDQADKIYQAHTGRASAPSGNMMYEAMQALPRHVADKIYEHTRRATEAMQVGGLHYAMARDAALKSESFLTISDDYILKAGEGSRGGHIIGHTKSGKPVYDHHDKRYVGIESNALSARTRAGKTGAGLADKAIRLAQAHAAEPNFSQDDHLDAKVLHEKNAKSFPVRSADRVAALKTAQVHSAGWFDSWIKTVGPNAKKSMFYIQQDSQ